jgi:hypothetical protein
MFVYKLIKTPFGWIYKKQDVIVVPRLADAPPLQTARDQRPRFGDDDRNIAANALLELSRGGKIKTKRQRNKNKVKKTRRKNKTKSKNKTKRRNKSTKYSRRRK